MHDINNAFVFLFQLSSMASGVIGSLQTRYSGSGNY